MIKIPSDIFKEEYGTSSLGNQRKFCIDNKWYKIDEVGYEGFAETITSNILKFSNVENFVLYEQESFSHNRKEYLGCVSENFRPENCKILTVAQIFHAYNDTSLAKLSDEKDLEKMIQIFIKQLSEITKLSEQSLGQYLTSIIELDALTLNCDRHFNNIAFLKMEDIFVPAPIFDNGESFLSSFSINDERDFDELIPLLSSKPFGYNFSEQKEVMENLYGYQLSFRSFSEYDILPKKILYSDKVIDRVLDTLQFQRHRYPELFETTLEYQLARASDKCKNEKTKEITKERERNSDLVR